jgi:hypothetical protein
MCAAAAAAAAAAYDASVLSTTVNLVSMKLWVWHPYRYSANFLMMCMSVLSILLLASFKMAQRHRTALWLSLLQQTCSGTTLLVSLLHQSYMTAC